MCGTAAEVSAVNSVDDRADPVPRPDDHGHRRRVRARPSAARSIATRTGWSMSTDRRAEPRPAAPVEIFDTTLRDGAQLEGISLTVEDKLRIAEQLDWLGVHCIEGGWPGRPTRRTRSSSARARDRAAARRRRRCVAFGSTRRVEGQGRRRPDAAQPGRGEHVDGVHRRQELGLPRHRGAADHARRGRGHGGRLGAVPAAATASRASSTPSTSSTATSATPSSRCGCSRPRPTQGADDARAVRHQRRLAAVRGRAASSARSSRYFGDDVAIGDPPHDDTGCGGGQRARRRARRRHAGAGHDQRLRRAHRQLQPHDDHPQPHVEDGRARRCPRAASSGSPRSATTSPSW